MLRMELRQLRYFVRIVDLGSMSRAADTLYIAQSALSLQMSKLEGEIGCRLLRRSSRGVQTTQAGERFHARAVRILRELDEARSDALKHPARPQGRVTVGLPASVSALCSVLLFRRAWDRLPDVTLTLHEATSVMLPELLLGSRFDIAILFADDIVKGIEAVKLFEEALYLAEPETDERPVGDRADIAIEALQGRRLLLTPQANYLRRLLDGACLVHGVSYSLAGEASSPHTIVNIMRECRIGTVGPLSVIGPLYHDPAWRVQRIARPALTRTLMLGWSQGLAMSDAVSATRDLVIDVMTELAREQPPIGS